jgi:hypothetical protein
MTRLLAGVVEERLPRGARGLLRHVISGLIELGLALCLAPPWHPRPEQQAGEVDVSPPSPCPPCAPLTAAAAAEEAAWRTLVEQLRPSARLDRGRTGD